MPVVGLPHVSMAYLYLPPLRGYGMLSDNYSANLSRAAAGGEHEVHDVGQVARVVGSGLARNGLLPLPDRGPDSGSRISIFERGNATVTRGLPVLRGTGVDCVKFSVMPPTFRFRRP